MGQEANYEHARAELEWEWNGNGMSLMIGTAHLGKALGEEAAAGEESMFCSVLRERDVSHRGIARTRREHTDRCLRSATRHGNGGRRRSSSSSRWSRTTHAAVGDGMMCVSCLLCCVVSCDYSAACLRGWSWDGRW